MIDTQNGTRATGATISIVASGSRGDVQPYVALGQALQQAGYRVRLLASVDFQPLAVNAGLEFHSMGESIEAIVQSEQWQSTLESGNFLSILLKMRSEMKQRAEGIAQLMPALLEGSDLIITGMAGISGAFTVAEMLDIPLIQAYVFPFTPTREFCAPLVPSLPFGGVLNRLSFHVTRQLFWHSSKMGDVVTRRQLGLAKGSFWGPYGALARRQVPALYGYSSHVLPQPHDWPENHRVSGYWFLDTPAGWSPPADLAAFLEAGDPPVYIGFGSMVNRNPQEAGAIALDALARSGQRGVLAAGWGGLDPQKLPESVHLISAVPHDWLFPRMVAVVHHGGAGTTAAGLRAGIPAIIVPFMGDQPFWGRRVAELGVGPQPIPRKQLNAAQAAKCRAAGAGNQRGNDEQHTAPTGKSPGAENSRRGRTRQCGSLDRAILELDHASGKKSIRNKWGRKEVKK